MVLWVITKELILWQRNAPMARAIAKYFGVTTDYLLGIEKSPDTEIGIEARKQELFSIARRRSPENYARLLDQAKLLQAVEKSQSKN